MRLCRSRVQARRRHRRARIPFEYPCARFYRPSLAPRGGDGIKPRVTAGNPGQSLPERAPAGGGGNLGLCIESSTTQARPPSPSSRALNDAPVDPGLPSVTLGYILSSALRTLRPLLVAFLKPPALLVVTDCRGAAQGNSLHAVRGCDTVTRFLRIHAGGEEAFP